MDNATCTYFVYNLIYYFTCIYFIYISFIPNATCILIILCAIYVNLKFVNNYSVYTLLNDKKLKKLKKKPRHRVFICEFAILHSYNLQRINRPPRRIIKQAWRTKLSIMAHLMV